MDSVRITEGGTVLDVPAVHSSGGPGKIYDTVFFNEQMAFNRDVSVMFLRSQDRDFKVADCMTATGARAVRIANEAPNTEVVANDINIGAIPWIDNNISINGLTNCTSSRKNLHSLLAEDVFDYIDLDPFGSPIPFLHSAIQGCKRKGILAITATDTAPLAGAHRPKCERRYQARPMRGVMCHEVGLRILMGNIAKDLARFDRGMKPLVCFFADHYFRAYVQVVEGTQSADACLDQMVYLKYDNHTLDRSVSKEKDAEHFYGPVWGGRLFDGDTLNAMSSDGMADVRRCDKMLDLWRNEYDGQPFLYDLSELASNLHVTTPRFQTVLDKMNENGLTTRTHMSPTAFKTVLSPEEVKALFREAAGQ